jgi:AbrB family looped-hinge helix DNA binding protein
MTSSTLQIRKKGSITLPKQIRDKYNMNEGDIYTLVDLGEGSFCLVPKVFQVDRLTRKIQEEMSRYGLSEEDLLNGLEEERKIYYQEKYVKP